MNGPPPRAGSGQAFAEVIGDPVAHSRSPLIHGFWLGKLGLAGEYRACHVAERGLGEFIRQRREVAEWRGCNVTLPHKLAALSCADEIDEVARAIGATNCLLHRPGGRITATNTDAEGFNEPIAELDLAGEEVVVVGAGGAARAVLAVLRGRQAGPVTLLNRSVPRAEALLGEFGLAGRAAPLDTPLPGGCGLLVNVSSLGMTGQPPLALDLRPLPATALVYDVVYAPLETPLLLAARRRGLRTVDGLAMLIGQAALAFELFFGQPAPRARDAELRALLTS